ncbi:MAG: MoxR family ATPase [Spirochaetes bacterium]|nr:MoxR family ATPase [Spirochaetota bacterium]
MAIKEFIQHMKSQMQKTIVGQEEVIEQICLSFLAGGHVILEGVPGLAKTMMARTFAKVIGVNFNRIQFTPDLMPNDILGTMVFNLEKSQFEFKKGPVFTNILLGDEINRASPKTQSALLEVMQEQQVTAEGNCFFLKSPFMVIATQNPIEFEGTYPLPEAQLDRFMLKLNLAYPEREVELAVLSKFNEGYDSKQLDQVNFDTIDLNVLTICQEEFLKVKVDKNILDYIMNLSQATRSHKAIILGASTRAAITLLNLSKYSAASQGRDYVIPDDVKHLAAPVLRHRIILNADAEIEGFQQDQIIQQIIEVEKVPR